MPTTNLDISNAIKSDMTSIVQDVTIPSKDTDGPSNKETRWDNSEWPKWFGYYSANAVLKAAIDKRAEWEVGSGWIADSHVTSKLDNITGTGFDTFDTIMDNMARVCAINGDSYSEIIRDDRRLINLKPLNPARCSNVVNEKGILTHYEYRQANGKVREIKPKNMLHFCNKRIADQIHGTSDIAALVRYLLADAESFKDSQTLQHRHVNPRFMWKLNTDRPAKIAAFQDMKDRAVNKGEDLIIPQGAVEWDLVAVPHNATLNPIPWRESIRDTLFQVVGIPQIMLGGSGGSFSEAQSKIAYLAYEQSVKAKQTYYQQQVWNKLQMRVTFLFPTSMKNELLSDEKKDNRAGAGPVPFQPADTIAGRAA